MTEAKGDGVTERESRRAPEGGVHAGGSHNHAWQLPYPEHETIGNSTQPVSEQTNGEEHTHVLPIFVCLREHDGQRRSRQKCRLVDVRRRGWGSGVGRWGHSWVPPRSGVSSNHMWEPCDLHVTCSTISLMLYHFLSKSFAKVVVFLPPFLATSCRKLSQSGFVSDLRFSFF